MLSIGEKIFVITRRLFKDEIPRHFFGEIQDASEMAIRVCGYSFIFDNAIGEFVRREDLRTRFFSLIDAGFVIYVIPREVNIEDIRYSQNNMHQRVVTDGKAFIMNASEFGSSR